MATTSPDGETSTTQPDEEVPKTQPRAYQLELFDESMKRNVIVTMDTGSGKTQIPDSFSTPNRAKLRIEAELERCPPEKLVWFIAPSVVLAEQQYRYLSEQLPAYSIRLTCGYHDPDRWGPKVWTAILRYARIVVSTPDILSDALAHGYVRMEILALLVFDEAHHAVGDSPVRMIMKNYYHTVLAQKGREQVPHILGLTASPITNEKAGSLEKLERDLDAVCRAPTIHLETLQQYVPKPQMEKLTYDDQFAPMPEALCRFVQAVGEFDILEDPYVKFLKEDDSPWNEGRLQSVLEKNSTDTWKELKKISRGALKLDVQLGSSAAVHFLHVCMQKLEDKIRQREQMVWLPAPEMAEHVFLRRFLSAALADTACPSWPSLKGCDVSPKVVALLDRLKRAAGEGVRGIIFVEERTTTWYLAHLISNHPITKEYFVAVPFVGTSVHAQKSTLVDHVDTEDQNAALDGFRAGRNNLMVATAVLEEGLDVPSVNLVVRFDPPPNFRAFIQSRGRARQAASTFVLMSGDQDAVSRDSMWEALEAGMKQKYMDETRVVAEREELEKENEESDEFLYNEATGARLSMHDVKQHLEHFCAKLPTVPYADPPRPEYILDSDVIGQYRADVVLPQGINIQPRRIRGLSTWKSEKMAKKDAAFRAYDQLCKIGLINEHLLPVALPDPVTLESDAEAEDESSLLSMPRRMNPWAAAEGADLGSCPHTLTLRHDMAGQEGYPELHLLFPWTASFSMALDLSWTVDQPIKVTVEPAAPCGGLSPDNEMLQLGRLSTKLLFESIFLKNLSKVSRTPWRAPLLMMPSLDSVALRQWVDACTDERCSPNFRDVPLESGLIRLRNWPKTARPYVGQSKFYRIREGDGSAATPADLSDSPAEELHLEVKRLPQRLDYLRPPSSPNFNRAVEVIPAAECRFDRFPTRYAKLMLLVPSILHRIEIRKVASTLSEELLAPVAFSNIELVEQAICASGANERSNYQRLELIGDSVLKFWTSVRLCARFPGWHEGYLSRGKDRVVSNAHLSWAARTLRLAEYIHTESFAGSQWKPPSGEPTDSQRTISGKVLADVVEALIGASFLDGQNEQERTLKVKASLNTLLTGMAWKSPAENASALRDLAPSDVAAFSSLSKVTEITGHGFEKQILLAEALTHPSKPPVGVQGSYQRLEFLGDSVLDFIVVQEMARRSRPIPHFTMHLIRAAVVNAHLLAFFCLGSSVEQARPEPTERGSGEVEITTVNTNTYLWQFMAHSGSRALVDAQKACRRRFEAIGPRIALALKEGSSHPWHLLLSLRAEKLFSDIVESILGAIFVDSRGKLQKCKEFLERLGLMRYLDRIMDETLDGTLDLMHPKERLGIVAGNSEIRYQTAQRVVDGSAKYSSSVFVDDVVLATSAGEVNKAAAETKAAERVIRILSASPGHDEQKMHVEVN